MPDESAESNPQEWDSLPSSSSLTIQQITKFRVKIYEMTDTGNWLDKGTGHVNCTFMVIRY
jgi:hypothetical protein